MDYPNSLEILQEDARVGKNDRMRKFVPPDQMERSMTCDPAADWVQDDDNAEDIWFDNPEDALIDRIDRELLPQWRAERVERELNARIEKAQKIDTLNK